MRPKILAPAGEWKSFLAAVECGADVVYLGGKSFNARQYAENFTMEEIKEAVRYAHTRGVEVYVTVNTLVFDEELGEVAHHLEELHRAGADAIIFQDLAVLEMGKRLQGLKLIASTQTTTHNAEAAKFLEKLGAHGVILARELSLGEIRKIRSTTDMWLEVFVHGALCFSYSGACLMSSIIGGRSGNRGRCAQPCRKRYKLIDQSGRVLAEGHLLSTKDLCLVNRLRDLVDAGVNGLKIEGRMRRPEYVAVVVDVYKRALERALKGKAPERGAVERLMSVFNRGFTEGYLDGNPGRELMNYERPDNVGVEVGVVTGLKKGVLKVRLSRELRVGDGLEIVGEWGKTGFIVSEILTKHGRVERAEAGETVSMPFDGEAHVGCKVYRTRDSQVVSWVERILEKAGCKMAGSAGRTTQWCSNQSLRSPHAPGGTDGKDARLLTAHWDTGKGPLAFPHTPDRFPDASTSSGQLKLSVRVDCLELLKLAVDYGADRVVIGGDYFKPRSPLSFEELGEGRDYCRDHGAEFMLSTPRITRNSDVASISSSLKDLAALKPDGVIAGNYGTLNLLLEASVAPVYADYFLNITNSVSLSVLRRLGIRGVTLSPELTLKQISSMRKGGVEVECLAHGLLELMVSEHCTARSVFHPEGRCDRPCFKLSLFIEDERGFRFPLAFDQNCRMHVLNSRDLCMIDALGKLAEAGINVVRLDCRARSSSYVEEVVRAYRSALDGEDPSPLKERLRKLSPLTRGHFFRGVA